MSSASSHRDQPCEGMEAQTIAPDQHDALHRLYEVYDVGHLAMWLLGMSGLQHHLSPTLFRSRLELSRARQAKDTTSSAAQISLRLSPHDHECLHSIGAMSSTVGAIRSTEKHR